jgi:predicted dehydrogenase/nucleoside-diphosphate-sugar epimerase
MAQTKRTTTMANTRLALIGCGAAAKRYYLPALTKHRDSIGALYLVDKNPEQAADLAQHLNGAITLTEYADCLSTVDGAIIVVPPVAHYRIASEFLSAGVHVLCEKPLAEKAQEVAALRAVADRTGACLCVNNTWRTFPSFRAAKDLIEAGRIGVVHSITFYEGKIFEWQGSTGFYVNPHVASKGVLQDLGAHYLDLVCWWLGAKPEVVRFQDDSFGGPESVADLEARTPTCDVRVFLNRLNALEGRFRIVGEKGTITGALYDWQKIQIEDASGNLIQKVGPRYRTYPDLVHAIFENFLRVIQKREQPLVSGADVHPSIALIEEAYSKRTRTPMTGYPRPAESPKAAGKILVTGATGFIGGRIVELLHLAGDNTVRAGIRGWSSAARLGRFPVDIVTLDLMRPETIGPALDGVTSVVHCAKGGGGVTDQGTRNLLETALKRGVRRFVHLSTADVYGNVTGIVTEATPVGYSGTEYNRTKIEAEKACWEYHAKGLPVAILRPSIVYGPFSERWSVRFAAMFLAGRGCTYERLGEGRCNLVFVDDLARAVFLALERKEAVGHAFNVVGPDVVTWNEYFRRLNNRMGLPPLPHIATAQAGLKRYALQPVRCIGGIVREHFMGPVKQLAATFAPVKVLLKRTEKTLKMTPAAEEFKLFQRDVLFPSTKAQQLMGYAPVVPLEAGIDRTVEWLTEQGFFLKDDQRPGSFLTALPERQTVTA